jgi:dTDP-4-amino-4,6-dideoxygalactose transaminase
MASLAEEGVETRAYFSPPIHEQRYFQPFADRPLPRTERLARRVLTLPFFTSITTEQMDIVADRLAAAVALTVPST